MVAIASSGCGSGGSKGKQSEPSQLQRALDATTRYAACSGHGFTNGGSSLSSLQAGFVYFPDFYGGFESCIVSANDCDAVLDCDGPRRVDIAAWPSCEGDPAAADHCDGNVAKICGTNDDINYYELSFDCDQLDGTCRSGQAEGRAWADCVVGAGLCAERGSRCDGARVISCEGHPERPVTQGWELDCGVVFDSTCAKNEFGAVACEGPAVGEHQCQDGEDNDADGDTDCDDSDCSVACEEN